MKNKYVAYYRVSSKRQKEEGVSLEAQQGFVKDYAIKHNLDIIREFEIDESANSEGRKIFNEMVELLERSPEIEGVVC